MAPRLLDPATVLSTFVHPMRELSELPRDEIEVWPYVDELGDDPFATAGNDVECVYRSADGRWDHVLVPSAVAPTYLVVVVDVERNVIVGHHVLTLNDQYGLPGPGK
jgi:hypothetical protein